MGLPATLSGLCTLVVVLVFFPLPSLGSIASHSNALQVSDNNEGISIAGHAPWQLRAWLATQLDLGPCDLILLCLSVYLSSDSFPLPLAQHTVCLSPPRGDATPHFKTNSYRRRRRRSDCGGGGSEPQLPDTLPCVVEAFTLASLTLSFSGSTRTPSNLQGRCARCCVCPFGTTSVRAVFSPAEQYERNGDTIRYGIVAHNLSISFALVSVGRSVAAVT